MKGIKVVDIKNPAGRYYEILKLAKAKSDNLKVRDVWSQVLDEDVANDSAITRKVIEVYQLGQEVKELVEMSKGVNTDLYLSSFPQIEKVIFPLNLDNLWKPQKQQLNDNVLIRLEFCSELLSTTYMEEAISSKDLVALTKLIDELFDALSTSSIDGAIRVILLEEVERLRASLSMYRIKGAKGLKQSLQSTIGMVVVNEDELKKLALKEKDIIDKLGKLIEKVDSFSAKALKINKALTKPVQFLIGLITDTKDTSLDNTEILDSEIET